MTATNVTMPSSGDGASQYTVTGIPASGTVTISCLFTGTITTARIPECAAGPIASTQVTAGQIESSDVQVQNVTITTMSEEMLQGARIARGTALMAVDRFYSAENSHEPRTEHWLLSITYYLNPKQVSDQSRVYPQYEFINPLGLTITEFHENRVSVDLIKPDASTGGTK